MLLFIQSLVFYLIFPRKATQIHVHKLRIIYEAVEATREPVDIGNSSTILVKFVVIIHHTNKFH